MREVFRNADSALVGLYQTVLEDAGIVCYIRNWTTQQAVFRGVAAAFVPIPEFYPALCVVHDEDYEEAMTVLRARGEVGEEWKCPACGEAVPANFSACWKCQTARMEPGVGG